MLIYASNWFCILLIGKRLDCGVENNLHWLRGIGNLAKWYLLGYKERKGQLTNLGGKWGNIIALREVDQATLRRPRPEDGLPLAVSP